MYGLCLSHKLALLKDRWLIFIAGGRQSFESWGAFMRLLLVDFTDVYIFP